MGATRIEFTLEALGILTKEQQKSLLNLYHDNVTTIVVAKGMFDLPEGYITFRCDYRTGQSMYGGISPEGDVST